MRRRNFSGENFNIRLHQSASCGVFPGAELATYNFETITTAEALAIKADDVVLFKGSSSMTTTVFYSADHVTIVFLDRSVAFGLQGVSQASVAGNLKFADGSQFYIGDTGANSKAFNIDDRLVTTLYGGAGADTLSGSMGDTFIHGNLGDDRITVSIQHNVVYGGQGDDVIVIGRSGARTQPGSFAHGNIGADLIQGGSGDDTLLGGQDNDTIFGNEGADYINGNLGADSITGGAHGGQLFGEAGDDTITGGTSGGAHYLSGGDGNDRLYSFMRDAIGSATLDGGAGADILYVDNAGYDVVIGGDGNDILTSARGAIGDLLYGGEGADTLTSQGHGDILRGGEGRDQFTVVSGKAVLYGEGGSDTFLLSTADISTAATVPEVHDWSSEDRLKFLNGSVVGIIGDSTYAERAEVSYVQALIRANEIMSDGAINCVAVQVNGDVVVFFDGIGWDDRADAAIILVGSTLGEISAANF